MQPEVILAKFFDAAASGGAAGIAADLCLLSFGHGFVETSSKFFDLKQEVLFWSGLGMAGFGFMDVARRIFYIPVQTKTKVT